MPAEEYIVVSTTIEKGFQEDDDGRGRHALTSLRGLKYDLRADESRPKKASEDTDAFGPTFTLVEQDESLYPSIIQHHLDSPSTIHRDQAVVSSQERPSQRSTWVGRTVK
jgi:DNA polymerase elongation subunit (family B)